MRKRARDRLIDHMIDAYVDWREESAEVESAYRRWTIAASPATAPAFAAYAAALDREELTSISYEQVMRQAILLLARERRRPSAAARHRAGGDWPSRRHRRRRRAGRARRRGSPPLGRGRRGDRSDRVRPRLGQTAG